MHAKLMQATTAHLVARFHYIWTVNSLSYTAARWCKLFGICVSDSWDMWTQARLDKLVYY